MFIIIDCFTVYSLQVQEEMEMEEEEDHFSSADTYANYRPAKCQLRIDVNKCTAILVDSCHSKPPPPAQNN